MSISIMTPRLRGKALLSLAVLATSIALVPEFAYALSDISALETELV